MTDKPPIVLVHGLWMTPSSWDTWANRYRERGARGHRAGWPGIGDRTPADVRRNPRALEGAESSEIVDSYDRIIRALPSAHHHGTPFGGIFIQMLLDRGLGVAGVGVEPGQTRRSAGAAVVDAAHGPPDPRQPLPDPKSRASSAERHFHYTFGNDLTRAGVRPGVGSQRRQLREPGLLRGSAVAAQARRPGSPRWTSASRPRPAAAHLGRHRPRRSAGDPEGRFEEVRPGDSPRGTRRVPRAHAPHRQPGRLGGSRRLRAQLGPHPRARSSPRGQELTGRGTQGRQPCA